jgi:hypothetical protein
MVARPEQFVAHHGHRVDDSLVQTFEAHPGRIHRAMRARTERASRFLRTRVMHLQRSQLLRCLGPALITRRDHSITSPNFQAIAPGKPLATDRIDARTE